MAKEVDEKTPRLNRARRKWKKITGRKQWIIIGLGGKGRIMVMAPRPGYVTRLYGMGER